MDSMVLVTACSFLSSEASSAPAEEDAAEEEALPPPPPPAAIFLPCSLRRGRADGGGAHGLHSPAGPRPPPAVTAPPRRAAPAPGGGEEKQAGGGGGVWGTRRPVPAPHREAAAFRGRFGGRTGPSPLRPPRAADEVRWWRGHSPAPSARSARPPAAILCQAPSHGLGGAPPPPLLRRACAAARPPGQRACAAPPSRPPSPSRLRFERRPPQRCALLPACPAANMAAACAVAGPEGTGPFRPTRPHRAAQKADSG